MCKLSGSVCVCKVELAGDIVLELCVEVREVTDSVPGLALVTVPLLVVVITGGVSGGKGSEKLGLVWFMVSFLYSIYAACLL